MSARVKEKFNFVVRYRNKSLEFAKGKKSIELADEVYITDVLCKVLKGVEVGDLVTRIEEQP